MPCANESSAKFDVRLVKVLSAVPPRSIGCRILLSLALAMLGNSAGQTQVTIDVAKITCKQLTLLKVNPDYVAIWLSGYYNGKRDNTIIEIEQFKELAAKVKRDCLYKNQGTVMETVEKLTGSLK